MPFDLVIDEHTADGQEARVSKTSVAGSWGAVAGMLRYFADRFGTPRAAIEGTTLSYDLVHKYATLSPPRIVLGGPRKHQRLTIERRRSYFGFELETELETLEDEVPPELQAAARDVLAQALWEGETTHPDQNRLRRTLGELDELWRRSGGTPGGSISSGAASEHSVPTRICPRLAGLPQGTHHVERGRAGESFDPRTTRRTTRSDPSPGRRCSPGLRSPERPGNRSGAFARGPGQSASAPTNCPGSTVHWCLLFSADATHRSWPIQFPTFRRCFDDLAMLPTMRNTPVPIAVGGGITVGAIGATVEAGGTTERRR